MIKNVRSCKKYIFIYLLNQKHLKNLRTKLITHRKPAAGSIAEISENITTLKSDGQNLTPQQYFLIFMLKKKCLMLMM